MNNLENIILTEKWMRLVREGPEQKRVIIIPGGFKPPHKGHVMMINHYLKNYPDADIVVYSGSKTRKGGDMNFGKEVALQIFELYKDAGVFADPSRLRFNFDLTQRDKKGGGTWESPFRDAIELAQSGEVAVGVGYSEKDSAYGARFDKAGGENAFDPGPAPSFEDMSATDFRNAIATNNQEEIAKFLPDGVDSESLMTLFMMDEDLRKWFGRKGAPGKKGGWVDCNAPKYKDGKKVGYKACGREKGEKRSKYPACRPTASACKSKGKGKKWGKKAAKRKKK